jgi:hypothetical protein
MMGGGGSGDDVRLGSHYRYSGAKKQRFVAIQQARRPAGLQAYRARAAGFR